jgi:hypothetical protein
MRPAQYASSSAKAPLKPEQMIATSPPAWRAARATAERLSSEPTRTTSQRDAAVRIERVPFVVVRINVFALGGWANSRGRRAEIEAVDDDGIAFPADDRFVPELPPQRLRFVDLRAAKNPLVAGRERLRDRRRHPDTSTTMPTRAEASSAGVKATSTCTPIR